jgi:hypothetical protein
MDKPDQPADKPTGTYISPKLREKLEEESGGRPGREEDQLPPWLGWLVLALLVVAGGAVAFGVISSNAEKKRQQAAAIEAARADSLRGIAVAESIETARRDTLRAESLAVAQGIRKPRPTPTPTPSASRATPPATGGGAAAAPPAQETRRYGLIVAEFIDETRANEEKDKLAQSTGLPGRVISVDGGNAFRVILGSFEGRTAAERAAADLSGKGLVSQAQVTALPR